MIQPINTFTIAPKFRNVQNKPTKKVNPLEDSQIAIINAGGIATVAGGLTTIIARNYTNSFAQAGVLGVFGVFLAMFFMTPHLINKINIVQEKKASLASESAMSGVKKTTTRDCFSNLKKIVHFKSEKLNA